MAHFLLPFGSFKLLVETLRKLGIEDTFYSLLGVSGWLIAGHRELHTVRLSTPFWEFHACKDCFTSRVRTYRHLSTPFWEFHGHSHIMRDVKLYRYHNLSTPFWEFPTGLHTFSIRCKVSAALSTPFWEFQV